MWDGRARVLFPQQLQRPAETVNQRGGSRGEMEVARVVGGAGVEFEFDAADLTDDDTRVFRQPERRCGRHQVLSGAGKKIGMEFLRQAAKLHADRARRHTTFLGGFSNAVAVDYGYEEFELPDFHVRDNSSIAQLSGGI